MSRNKNLQQNNLTIKILGVGGGGGNTLEYMLKKRILDNNLGDIDFIYLNTGAKSFSHDYPYKTLQIGRETTKGLGAGANPEKGKAAALEEKERISEIIGKTDLLFLTAGMGGGTGTGAIPVIAEIAKNQGILTIAVVTKPFTLEGNKRMKVAEQGILELKNHVDSLIIIHNQKLLPTLGKDISLVDAFNQVNNILLHAVEGIADLLINPGFINIDFADMKSVMSNMGMSIMGTGCSTGPDRAETAFNKAIFSPLLEHVEINNAKGILVNVMCGNDLSIAEFQQIGELVKGISSHHACIVVGSALDNTMSGKLCVTIVATGLEEKNKIRLVKS